MIQPENFSLPKHPIILFLLLQFLEFKMSFQSFNFNLVINDLFRIKLVQLRLKRAILQLMVFLSSSCLRYGSLLCFQFLFQLLRKRLALMWCIFRSQVGILFFYDTLGLESTQLILLLLNLSNQFFFPRLSFVVLMSLNNRQRRRYFFRNRVNLRLKGTFIIQFFLDLLLL